MAVSESVVAKLNTANASSNFQNKAACCKGRNGSRWALVACNGANFG
jgi:hypothetical protein